MSAPVVRGYITSRPVRGNAVPQRVQNLVVRDYAARRGLAYRLAAVEYAMPGCSMILEGVLADLDRLDGVVLYSLFLLPDDPHRRRAIYDRVLAAGRRLYAALEDLVLATPADAALWEDLIDVAATLPATPFGGRYEKNDEPLGPDAERLVEIFERDGATPARAPSSASR